MKPSENHFFASILEHAVIVECTLSIARNHFLSLSFTIHCFIHATDDSAVWHENSYLVLAMLHVLSNAGMPIFL